jgi:hypothetical protein
MPPEPAINLPSLLALLVFVALMGVLIIFVRTASTPTVLAFVAGALFMICAFRARYGHWP